MMMKKLTPIVVSLSLALTNNAVANEFDDLHKQLDIMSNIIKSSVAVQKSHKGSNITGVETTYLKGQGVVFTINSSSRSNHWGNYNFNFVMPEIPPLPPIPPASKLSDVAAVFEDERSEVYIDTDDFSGNLSDVMEKAAESYERAMDSLNNDREMYRDLRDQQRDLSYEVRDLEREKRDIQYQMRRADKSSQAELAEQAKALEAQQAKIEKARVELEAKSAELRKQQQLQKAEQEKERTQYYQGLTTSIVEAFCSYGNGLKAVPKNENISLIIKSGGDKVGNRFKDNIYVFSKKDITNCAIDNINAKALFEKGKGYQF